MSGRPRALALLARTLGAFGPALIGQVGSFGALIVPILGHRFESVALLVTVTAVGGVGSLLGSWAFAGVYPSIRTGVTARPAVLTAIAGTGAVAVLLVVAAASVARSAPHIAEVLALSALFAVSQSAYFLALGFWIRQNAVRRIGHVRLVYGLSNLVLASLATLSVVPDSGLSAATSLAFLGASAATLFARPRIARLLLATTIATSAAAVQRYALLHWRAALAGVLSTIGLQASAVIVLGFADLRAVWAVVLRITGGFGTIGVSILGPRVQAALARAARRGDVAGAVAANRRGLAAGLALTGFSLATLTAILVYTRVLGTLGEGRLAPVVALIVVFLITTTAVSPISANLVIAGRQRLNLVLNVVRVAALVPALLVRQPLAVLAILVLAESAVQIAQAVASLLVARELAPAPAAGRDQSSTAIGSSGVT